MKDLGDISQRIEDAWGEAERRIKQLTQIKTSQDALSAGPESAYDESVGNDTADESVGNGTARTEFFRPRNDIPRNW